MVWENSKLNENTKAREYRDCVLTTFIYGSEAWTTYAKQKQCLNSCHLRCLRRTLGITWQEHTRNEGMSLGMQTPQQVHPVSDVCIGLAMSAAWKIDVCQRTMVTLTMLHAVLAVQLCGSGVLANEISNLLR